MLSVKITILRTKLGSARSNIIFTNQRVTFGKNCAPRITYFHLNNTTYTHGVQLLILIRAEVDCMESTGLPIQLMWACFDISSVARALVVVFLRSLWGVCWHVGLMAAGQMSIQHVRCTCEIILPRKQTAPASSAVLTPTAKLGCSGAHGPYLYYRNTKWLPYLNTLQFPMLVSNRNRIIGSR